MSSSEVIATQHFLESDWYKERPAIIQEAIKSHPPTQYYSLNGKQCYIYSYAEPLEEGEVTVTVHKTGVGGPMAEMGLGTLDTNAVFGVKLSDLEVWKTLVLPDLDWKKPCVITVKGRNIMCLKLGASFYEYDHVEEVVNTSKRYELPEIESVRGCSSFDF